MLTRRWILNGLIAAPAVIVADRLMPVHSPRPLRLLTVNDLRWREEVNEYSLRWGIAGFYPRLGQLTLAHGVRADLQILDNDPGMRDFAKQRIVDWMNDRRRLA